MNNDETQNTQSLPTAGSTPGAAAAAPPNPASATAPPPPGSTPGPQPPPADQPSHSQPEPSATDLWDLQPGESQKAFAAFKQYLDLGASATLEDVATTAKLSQDSVEHFSRRYHWRERAAAYRQAEAKRQAESLHNATDESNALLAQRASILRQQRWERSQDLGDLADHARDLALKAKDIPVRLDHVARLYTVADKLGDSAVQPITAALLPIAEQQAAIQEVDIILKKLYGPMAAQGVVPSVHDQINRERTPAQPATPPAAPDTPKTS